MANNDPRFSHREIAQRLYNEDILSGSDQRENQPYLMDLRTLERVFFQSIPRFIEVNPETHWAVIHPPGRNLPNFQYTGSEDTIEFIITWYCNDESRQDVIRKCKWIESLGKNDAWDDGVPEVQFCFGDLFSESKWIVYGAPYKLGNFSREHKMMPCYAEQKLVLKKVSSQNPNRTTIQKYNT